MNVALQVPSQSAPTRSNSLTNSLPGWCWALAGVMAVQIGVAALFPVLPEEAYHWNFGRHLDFSYHDHPPMLPWAIALGRCLLGDTALGIRLVPLLFSLGTFCLLARMAQRFYGPSAALWAVLLYALQPAAFLIGGWGFPDSPLLFFWMLTLTCVWHALEARRPAWWLAAGAALGAAMLSKYTAAFLVVSVFLYLIFSRRDRYWLATPWPYLAGVCSLVIFAPVIYWNFTHDWVSFRMQSTNRFQAANRVGLDCGLQATAEQWVLVLPLTLPLAAWVFRRLLGSARTQEAFLLWCFAPMAAFFFVLGWTPSWHVLWSLPAYLALTVTMAGALAQLSGSVSRFYRNHWRWLVGVEACGVVVIVLHAVFVIPVIPPLRTIYGWDEVARRCRVLQAALPGESFFMSALGRGYVQTSQLAFHLNAPLAVHGQDLIGQPDLQYRWWDNPQELAGKDAVVVVEGELPDKLCRAALRPYFETVETVETLVLPVGTIGSWSNSTVQFRLYLGHGYHSLAGKPASN